MNILELINWVLNLDITTLLLILGLGALLVISLISLGSAIDELIEMRRSLKKNE